MISITYCNKPEAKEKQGKAPEKFVKPRENIY